ncbi:MAG: dihydroorotase [Planktomarina sp.]|nr:dihydroorotase [Planktomarina sp.]|tara:strand:- start:269 stop:1342 length:1074 start_codon:yes stop_codon:yes gene_type:complete
METRLTIIRPDDWHLHLRDGAMLAAVAPESARNFGRALIMPNLTKPVITFKDAKAYRARIMATLPKTSAFQPLMTLYLTEKTDPKDVKRAFESGFVIAVKLYPAGATTNSEFGVHNFENLQPILECMSDIGMPLCVHGEVTNPEIDIFDREAVFIDKVLEPLRKNLPNLKVVMEHITTLEGVAYAKSEPGKLAATITTHHLMINRNHLLAGGIRPHYYCLPVAKREQHRVALLEAATSGNPCYFLGTDSAPHADTDKESSCGCAGIFTATNSVQCLAEVFDRANALNKLEGFISVFGAHFYGLAPNQASITITKGSPIKFPKQIKTYGQEVTIFNPNINIHWQITSRTNNKKKGILE